FAFHGHGLAPTKDTSTLSAKGVFSRWSLKNLLFRLAKGFFARAVFVDSQRLRSIYISNLHNDMDSIHHISLLLCKISLKCFIPPQQSLTLGKIFIKYSYTSSINSLSNDT